MWYVIQTRSGREITVKKLIENVTARDGDVQCKLLYCERKRRYQGAWHDEQRLALPGYIFVITDDVDKLYLQLKSVHEFTRILGAGDDIVPLSETEVETIRRLSGENDIVPMSYGVQIGDKVIIKEGNLKGFESLIRKVDRHKKKAYIEIELLGETRLVEVGLEIVEKR